MTRFLPGFFLDPKNWWALSQNASLPAYPRMPSQQLTQSIIDGDDGSTSNQQNVTQGLLDFAGLASPAISGLNMSPGAPFASPFQTKSLFGAGPIGATQNAAGRILDAQETTGARISKCNAATGSANERHRL